MKQRKVPLRTCVVTKEKLEKKDLIRIVRTPDNKIIIDLTNKANGRGSYLKKDLNIIIKAQKSKVLERHLESVISDSIYEELKDLIRK